MERLLAWSRVAAAGAAIGWHRRCAALGRCGGAGGTARLAFRCALTPGFTAGCPLFGAHRGGSVQVGLRRGAWCRHFGVAARHIAGSIALGLHFGTAPAAAGRAGAGWLVLELVHLVDVSCPGARFHFGTRGAAARSRCAWLVLELVHLVGIRGAGAGLDFGAGWAGGRAGRGRGLRKSRHQCSLREGKRQQREHFFHFGHPIVMGEGNDTTMSYLKDTALYAIELYAAVHRWRFCKLCCKLFYISACPGLLHLPNCFDNRTSYTPSVAGLPHHYSAMRQHIKS